MPAESFVVDASAIAKLVQDEEHSEALRRWHRTTLDAGGRMLAPHLLRYEVGNLLVRNASRLPDASPSARQDLLARMLLGYQFADAAGIEAFAPPLSFYDAAYVALAHSLKATLVTYDDRMLGAARKAKVKTLSPGA